MKLICTDCGKRIKVIDGEESRAEDIVCVCGGSMQIDSDAEEGR